MTVVLSDLGVGRTEMIFEQRGRLSPDHYERAGQGEDGNVQWAGAGPAQAPRAAVVTR